MLIDYKTDSSLVQKIAKIVEEYQVELYRNVIREGIEIDLLIRGSIGDVIKATKKCIAEVSPSGRHILSSANTITSGTKSDNLKAIIETAQQFGCYPINMRL